MRTGMLAEPEKLPGYARAVVKDLYERNPMDATPLQAR
jgi:hypothetical protein